MPAFFTILWRLFPFWAELALLVLGFCLYSQNLGSVALGYPQEWYWLAGWQPNHSVPMQVHWAWQLLQNAHQLTGVAILNLARQANVLMGLALLALLALGLGRWSQQPAMRWLSVAGLISSLGYFSLVRSAGTELPCLIGMLLWLLLLHWLWPHRRRGANPKASWFEGLQPVFCGVGMAALLLGLGLVLGWFWAALALLLGVFSFWIYGYSAGHASSQRQVVFSWPAVFSALFTLLVVGIVLFFVPLKGGSSSGLMVLPATFSIKKALLAWSYQALLGAFPWVLFLPSLWVAWGKKRQSGSGVAASSGKGSRQGPALVDSLLLASPWLMACTGLVGFALVSGLLGLVLFRAWLPPVLVWLPMVLGLVVPLAASAESYWSRLAAPSHATGRNKNRLSLDTLKPNDWTFLSLVVIGLALTVFVFAYLPNTYPEELWQLPGHAMFHIKVKDNFLGFLQIPNAFPLWKLWLLPIPFWMLLGAILLYALDAFKWQRYRMASMAVWSVCFLAFSASVTLPVLYPNQPLLRYTHLLQRTQGLQQGSLLRWGNKGYSAQALELSLPTEGSEKASRSLAKHTANSKTLTSFSVYTLPSDPSSLSPFAVKALEAQLRLAGKRQRPFATLIPEGLYYSLGFEARKQLVVAERFQPWAFPDAFWGAWFGGSKLFPYPLLGQDWTSVFNEPQEMDSLSEALGPEFQAPWLLVFHPLELGLLWQDHTLSAPLEEAPAMLDSVDSVAP
jgi:hypothetical protein